MENKFVEVTLPNGVKGIVNFKDVSFRQSARKRWVCNECNFPNFTESVSEAEIEQELMACINCGGFEFHLA